MNAQLARDIHPFYRGVFLYFEPLLAVIAAYQLIFTPAEYLPWIIPSPQPVVDHGVQMLCTSVGAAYVGMVWNNAVLLRVTSELAVWRTMFLGVLLSDVGHLYGSLQTMGAGVFWNPVRWRTEDWVNVGLLYFTFILRIAFLLGIGVRTRGPSAAKKAV